MDIHINQTAVPALGYGTFQITDQRLVDLVANALNVGYRHIDTARMYGNEHLVGEGLKKSGAARDSFFLTTKIQPKEFRHNDLLKAMKDSLQKLQTDHVDLVLMHWPNPDVRLEETLGALNEARDLGMTRHIGVSNFTTALLDEAVATSSAPIFMNQIEFHPFLDQTKVIAKCREHGIGVTAYSPLARANVLGNATLQKIGNAHDKNEAQIALRWLLDQGVVAIPKTENENRQTENFDIFDFELTADEIHEISSLATSDGRLIDPSFAPDWD